MGNVRAVAKLLDLGARVDGIGGWSPLERPSTSGRNGRGVAPARTRGGRRDEPRDRRGAWRPGKLAPASTRRVTSPRPREKSPGRSAHRSRRPSAATAGTIIGNALVSAAAHGGRVEALAALLNRGADVNRSPRASTTRHPLHYAALDGARRWSTGCSSRCRPSSRCQDRQARRRTGPSTAGTTRARGQARAGPSPGAGRRRHGRRAAGPPADKNRRGRPADAQPARKNGTRTFGACSGSWRGRSPRRRSRATRGTAWSGARGGGARPSAGHDLAEMSGPPRTSTATSLRACSRVMLRGGCRSR